DVENYLDKFPNQRKELEEYADIIGSFNGLKNISADSEFENEALKEVYLRARVESLKNGKKIPKKDMVLLNLRPAYLKPLMIFIGVFILLTFSFTGTVFASENSVPGDVLYSVKRTSENIHLALIPLKYESGLYVKILDERLGEADIILDKDDFKDLMIAEKLVTDIDSVYKKCIERNYLDINQRDKIQRRIRGIKEGFRNKCKNQGNDIGSSSDKDSGNHGLSHDYKNIQDNSSGSHDSETGSSLGNFGSEDSKRNRNNQVNKN
ncbi:MAG: DUF5667 domain-containing protein, partial [Actinomycetota bacterium]|nr:DUF5667 domain-containing protein [Actinomycetota bacterium]